MEIQAGPDQGRILFVDDQPLTRLSVTRLLKKFSFEVTCAGTGELALAHLNSHIFDLCVFDIGLPDFDGLVMMKIVKEISPDIPVIIITGGNVDGSMQPEIEAYAVDLISKPFECNYFVDCILDSLQAPKNCWNSSSYPGVPLGGKERRSVRKASRRKIDFTYNHFLASDVEGNHKMMRQDLQGATLDKSDDGLGLQTNFPLTKNHVIGFKEEREGKFGVIKWSTQINDEAYNCGLKFI